MDTGLVYADIKCTEDSSSRRSSNFNVVQQADHRRCPPWHWIVLWLSCTGNVLLMAAVILMGVYGLGYGSSAVTNRNSQNSQEMTGILNAHQCQQDKNKTNRQLEKLRTFLRQHLCEATESRFCSICPITWLLYEDKCYWISTSIQSWNQSYKDCEAKRSQLLVISSTGEQVKEFVTGIHPGQNKDEYMDWAQIQIAREGMDMDQRLTIKTNPISTLNGWLWYYRKEGNII